MNLDEKTYDLTECDREAIHNIGMVQPFGAFLKVNADWTIAHRSLNCHTVLGLNQLPEVGSNLGELIGKPALEALQGALARLNEPDQVERLFGLQLTDRQKLFDCAIHRVRERVILEFEPHDSDGFESNLHMASSLLKRLSSEYDLDSLCQKTCQLVRELLGYDRVLIYKFHPDDSGEVIAEEARSDLEPYLGLRYPRTDIPQQARELFMRNKFRVIADRDAKLAKIDPPANLNGAPLDLSMSTLRASASVHLDYLRNMGVAASMTIAIVRQEKLWGLISCHHCEPKLPSCSVRTLADMLSETFALILDRILLAQANDQREKNARLHEQLMLQLEGGSDLFDALPAIKDLLSRVITNDGITVLVEGVCQSHGAAPSVDEFKAILPLLNSAPTGKVLTTSALSDTIPAASQFAQTAAGAMILPISGRPRDYMILWRKPLTRTVKWAGNPENGIEPKTGKLEPRNSFAEWAETVKGRSAEWSDEDISIAEGLRVSLLEVMLRITDDMPRERQRAQEQQELLIAELNHRVRNILNLIRSLVSQSQSDAMSVESFATIIGGRISALATAHDNITRENWSPASLSSLLHSEFSAYLAEKQDRFVYQGKELLVRPEAYTVLALVFHELVTNSAKYGSLCDRFGSVDVFVSCNEAGDATIAWREHGGPPVKPPKRSGFGSTIIKRSIPFELSGKAEMRFKLSGLEADFTIPARFIEPAETSEDQKAELHCGETVPATREADGDGVPEHVLIVEDSIIIAMDVEQNLKRLGVPSVKVESTVDGALKAIEARLPDLAIVDYNLGQENSVPVAQALRERGVRFVLATGYSEGVANFEELGASDLLRKPYGLDEIRGVLTAAVAPSEAAIPMPGK